MPFQLTTEYSPAGDQPQAIERLVEGLRRGFRFQTLLGATGTGKTFTVASVIARADRPALIISHNKTLAAQLAAELRAFFPNNAVEYFVSYYDYYQPEAYVPQLDLYIAKEAEINAEIDRLRHRATQALLTRRDVVIVASVSCIYIWVPQWITGRPPSWLGLGIDLSGRSSSGSLLSFTMRGTILSLVRVNSGLGEAQ